MDDIRKNFVRSKEFQGRSDADKRSALRGIKRRRAARGQKVGVSGIREQLDKRGIKHSKTGSRRGTFAGRPVRGTHARRRTRSINTGSRVAKGNRRRVNSLAKHVGLTAGLGL